MNEESASSAAVSEGVAIVGLAVRVPGANSVEGFWRNLRAGVESVTFFTDAELRAAGVPAEQLADPRYVRANGVLNGAEEFDAAFFGLTPREAEATDPQHRVLLELAWEALERAGYDPAATGARTGVFAGAGLSTYLLRNLLPNRAFAESVGELALLLGNNKDFAPTRLSYKLDLRGPSVAVNTACSTSLVAVHLACQSLLDCHCDLALAGGVSVQVPQAQGYLYQPGGIGSPDGHCRAFDARAHGTVGGNGAGLVVLKRMADALADGDTILAVIRGSAVNNDGAGKVGFTAPGVDGQAAVIAEALAVAGVEPGELSYVEAHGTGTELGDPIEVAALTQVFGGRAPAGSCALGSVKTNFGHLDEAAGVAGLAKTVLALVHRELPPSLHFAEPNPKIDFGAGPFFVNAQLAPWPTRAGAPRRAGVSSFGLGGTNAHVVLEEAPPAPASDECAPWQLLVLSARTTTALARAAENLAAFLASQPGVPLADIAYTLAVGRHAFERRQFLVARNGCEAADLLREKRMADEAAPAALMEMGTCWAGGGAPDLAALFAGQRRRRVELPTYAFDRRRFWIEPARAASKRTNVAEWLYQPSWKQVVASVTAQTRLRSVLWLGDEDVAEPIVAVLRAAGHRVMVEGDPARVAAVLAELAARAAVPDEIVHGWCMGPVVEQERFDGAQRMGYERLLALVQALNRAGLARGSRLTVISAGIADVTGVEPLSPARATLVGLARVIPQEFPGLECRVIDAASDTPAAALASEIAGPALEAFVALRGTQRWVHGYEPLGIEAAAGEARLRERGVYLITGGLGGVGLIVAAYLARTVRARLVLAARQGLPPRADWPRLRAAKRIAFDLESDAAELAAAGARMARPDQAGSADLIRDTDALCAVLLYRYIADRPPGVIAGGRTAIAALRERLGVQRPFWKFIDYALRVLASDGYVRLEGEDVVWSRGPAEVPAAEEAIKAFTARRPELSHVAGLLRHCAAHYADALGGREAAIGALYSDAGAQLLEAAGLEAARHSNKDAAIDSLRQLVERFVAAAGGRRVRILEVGVGDGLLAGRIAPGLQGRNVDYTATDISRAFLVKAESAAAAAGLGGVTFGVLDIARDPVAQGYPAGGFDLILALDVVHATPRVAATLGHLHRLLAPGGVIGALEKVRTERWVDLVWGLAEGWWYFEDAELRAASPLLPAAAWERVLGGLPFGAARVLPEGGPERAGADYALLVAQAAGAELPIDPSAARAASRIAAVLQLETLGAEVVVEEADAADAGQMRAVVARAERRFGAVHGVVHTAGLTTGSAVFNPLPEANPAQAAALFRPKAGGAEALAEVLAGHRLDFCVLISSNASVLGGLGLGAYAAANAFLDAFAADQRRRGDSGWTSANWDGWPTEEYGAATVRTSVDQFAMTRAEAETAFASVLAAPVAQVVVSAGDLDARLAHWARPGADAAAPNPRGGAPAAVAPEASGFHARPALPNAYVAPQTDTERLVAGIWSELLGIDAVGAEDNFFDLGGDSLIGTQVLTRLGRSFGVSLSMAALFEAQTLAAMAARLDSARAAAANPPAGEEEGAL